MTEVEVQLMVVLGEADWGPGAPHLDQVLTAALLPITGRYKTQEACT